MQKEIVMEISFIKVRVEGKVSDSCISTEYLFSIKVTIFCKLSGCVGITSRIQDYIASSLNHSYTESTLHVVFFETNNYAKRDSK